MSKKSEEKINSYLYLDIQVRVFMFRRRKYIMKKEYTYSIEKIYIKELKRDEVTFCVYKATRRGDETYIPRSLDVTELELIELIKESIREKVFSEGFIEMLKQEINKI